MKNLNFIKKVLLTFFLGLAILSSNATAKTITVEKKFIRVREGAGNFYSVIHKLKKGSKIEILGEKGKWLKISLPDGNTGYISKRSLKKKKRKKIIKGLKEGEEGVKNVATSEIIAATKGLTDIDEFTKKYAKDKNLDISLLKGIHNPSLTEEEYENFKSKLSNSEKIHIKTFDENEDYDHDIMIGRAIALKILSKRKASSNNNLIKYVYKVGSTLVENTPAYDLDFYFIILNDDKIRSFAAPGGYIFITSGAIKKMKNEAELSGVLAHEIIHVVNRHGIKSLTKRKTKIKSDKMFDSLGGEIDSLGFDPGDIKLYNEMSNMVDNMYNIIMNGRSVLSEDDADEYGTFLAFNTGYSEKGLRDFFETLNNMKPKFKNPANAHKKIEYRIQYLDHIIKEKKLTGNPLLKNRFNKHAR